MFISRNPEGNIYGAWTVQQFEGQEEIQDDDSELRHFLGLEPTHAEVVAAVWTAFRTLRAQFFTRLDYMRLDALTADDVATAQTIKVAVVILRNMPVTLDLTALNTATEMRAAVTLAWKTAIAGMPAELRVKFTEAGGA